jgi:hypothetical protein
MSSTRGAGFSSRWGEQMVFTYLPGKGTTLAVNGKDKNGRRRTVWPTGFFGLAWTQAAYCQPEKAHTYAVSFLAQK